MHEHSHLQFLRRRARADQARAVGERCVRRSSWCRCQANRPAPDGDVRPAFSDGRTSCSACCESGPSHFRSDHGHRFRAYHGRDARNRAVRCCRTYPPSGRGDRLGHPYEGSTSSRSSDRPRAGSTASVSSQPRALGPGGGCSSKGTATGRQAAAGRQSAVTAAANTAAALPTAGSSAHGVSGGRVR